MYALTRFSLDHQRLTVAALMLVTVALAAGLPRLQHAYGYAAIIGPEHPVIQTLNDMVDEFGGGIPARIRWECGEKLPCASVFDRASLEMAAALTEQLRATGGVRDIYGIANSGLLIPGANGFSVRRFVERGVPVADAEELAGFAVRDPSWLGSLISRDLRVGTLFVVPEASDHRTELDGLTRKVVETGLATWTDSGSAGAGMLIVRGQAKLLEDVTAMTDLERIRALFEMLETKEALLRLIQAADIAEGVQIFIGADNELFSLAGCAMIIAPYQGSGEKIVGAIGVVGPTRMNYARIIPMVDYTATVVGKLIGES